jgi:hypothetical protein
MTKEQLDASMLAKGFLLGPNGQYTKVHRVRDKVDPGPAQPEQISKPKAAPAKLSRPVDEKPQDVDNEGGREAAETAAADYQTGVSTVEGEGHPKFRISVTLYISEGRRDPTGMLETIADLITATRRRLMERLPGGVMEVRSGSIRPGGSKNSSGKAGLEEDVPF